MGKKFTLNHNSHILVGGPDSALDFIEPVLNKLIPSRLWPAHPDVWRESFDQFKVEDGRLLKTKVSKRPLSGTVKIFLLTIEVITPEAQNTLLKVLEEPQGDAYIFLIVSDPNIFLDTVKSRCEIITLADNPTSDIFQDQAYKFVTASVVERINFINTLHLKKELTKSFFSKFLVAVKQELEARGDLKQLGVVLEVEKYLYDKSFLPKLALEYLAVSL